jgi:hypothetical protein
MKKVDELIKNRREMDRENISGHMPEDREMPEYCPVRNFETYLQKLHPQHLDTICEACRGRRIHVDIIVQFC